MTLEEEAVEAPTASATPVDIAWKPTPIEVMHPERVDPASIRLFRDPPWKLRMTIGGDRSYIRVKVTRAAPLTEPDRYFCFLDVKDEAICMVKDLDELTEENHALVLEELDKRYITSYIQSVNHIRNEYGVSYWDVETDRGPREFVARNVAENAQWLGEGRLFILDVDSNRFEIVNIAALDRKSRSFIDLVL